MQPWQLPASAPQAPRPTNWVVWVRQRRISLGGGGVRCLGRWSCARALLAGLDHWLCRRCSHVTTLQRPRARAANWHSCRADLAATGAAAAVQRFRQPLLLRYSPDKSRLKFSARFRAETSLKCREWPAPYSMWRALLLGGQEAGAQVVRGAGLASAEISSSSPSMVQQRLGRCPSGRAFRSFALWRPHIPGAVPAL